MAQQFIISDLNETLPLTLFIPPLSFQEDEPLQSQVKTLYRQMLRSKRMKNRRMMLFYAFHLGEIMEVFAETPLQRSLYMNLLTTYYQRAVIKVYYIFEPLGVAQIFRSNHVTLKMIYQLKQPVYLELIETSNLIMSERLISLEQDS